MNAIFYAPIIEQTLFDYDMDEIIRKGCNFVVFTVLNNFHSNVSELDYRSDRRAYM